MDPELIKALIDALEASDLSELEYSRGGATLRLVKRSPGGSPAPASVVLARSSSPDVPSAAPVATPPLPGLVRSPLFGIVHLQRTPGAAPLVSAGQAVAAGQVLCLVEAMKVFTELRAERDGTITAVLVQTGQEVEAGQALFQVE